MKKYRKIIMVFIVIIFIFGGICIFSRKHIPVLVLKEKNFNIEYGETFKPTFNNIVDVRGLNKNEIKYLKNNIRMSSHIQNEEQKNYPAVGKYKVVIKYNDQQLIIHVIFKDTIAPNIEVLKGVEVLKGTNLDTFDFKNYVKINDLSLLKDIKVDSCTVNVNKAGEYKVTITVEDIYGNKAESELPITIIEQKKDVNLHSENNSNYSNQRDLNVKQENNKLKEENKIKEEKSEVIKQDDNQSNQQTTIYWYKCKLCGVYVESKESLEDAKRLFYEMKCTDEIEKSGIDWRHSRYHYGINHS